MSNEIKKSLKAIMLQGNVNNYVHALCACATVVMNDSVINNVNNLAL